MAEENVEVNIVPPAEIEPPKEQNQDILIATLTDIKEMQRQLHERIDAISQRVDGISEEYSATLGGYEDAVQRILFLEAEVDGLVIALDEIWDEEEEEDQAEDVTVIENPPIVPEAKEEKPKKSWDFFHNRKDDEI
jgi:hypothetical protein